LIEIDMVFIFDVPVDRSMSGFPREVDLRQTPHFLFETGSIMLVAFGVLFVVAGLLTAAVTYLTGSFPLVGGVAIVTSGALALLGTGLLYWSSTFAEF
jgi:hypothetical protein